MKLSTVRHRDDTGWEMQCPDCREKHQASWWPLMPLGEYWNPLNMARCKACHLELRREREKGRPRPYMIRYRIEAAHVHRLKQRDRYWANRDNVRAYQKAYRAANRERMNARRRELYAAQKAAERRQEEAA